MGHQRLLSDGLGMLPCRLNQLFGVDIPVGILAEEKKQVIFLDGKINPFSFHLHRMIKQVDAQIAKCKDCRLIFLQCALIAEKAKLSSDPGNHFYGAEGFLDIMIPAEAKSQRNFMRDNP